MNQDEIRTFLDSFKANQARTIVIVDFANVDKWENSLNWKVGIQELARLIRHFSVGSKPLRRFYYGSDYGPHERSTTLSLWSQGVLSRADMNRFEVVTKPVKYIHEPGNPTGYNKKCDFDVEMAIDLVRLQSEYDNIVLFSGDGDLVYALRYLRDAFGKSSYVFGARGHVGKEVVDATREGIIQRLLYADDFKYRLDSSGHRRR